MDEHHQIYLRSLHAPVPFLVHSVNLVVIKLAHHHNRICMVFCAPYFDRFLSNVDCSNLPDQHGGADVEDFERTGSRLKLHRWKTGLANVYLVLTNPCKLYDDGHRFIQNWDWAIRMLPSGDQIPQLHEFLLWFLFWTSLLSNPVLCTDRIACPHLEHVRRWARVK